MAFPTGRDQRCDLGLGAGVHVGLAEVAPVNDKQGQIERAQRLGKAGERFQRFGSICRLSLGAPETTSLATTSRLLQPPPGLGRCRPVRSRLPATGMMREIRVGQIDHWSFGPGTAIIGSGGRTPGLRPVFSAFSARASSFASDSNPFQLKAFARPRLDHILDLGDAGQTILAPGNFLGHRHPVASKSAGTGRLGHRHQIGHLGLQPGFEFSGVFPRQRAVTRLTLACTLVPSSATVPSFSTLASRNSSSTSTNSPSIRSRIRRRAGGYGIVVGMTVGRDEAESDRVIARALQLAARKHPRGVAVDQKPQ